MLQQNILMGMQQEAVDQEDVILQHMTSNTINSITDFEHELYDGLTDLDF